MHIIKIIFYFITMEHVNNYNHYIVMFFIMIISGFLTTMNVFVNNISDIRLSLNDIYMNLMMTGWMFLFMGIYYKENYIFLIGLCLVLFNFLLIRTQFMISEKQYLLGMIPHHSMAIFMSKKLLEKQNSNKEFLEKIINNQSNEIDYMKKV